MQIHAHGAVGHARALGDLGPRHALDEAHRQGFPIGVGEGADRPQDFVGFGERARGLRSARVGQVFGEGARGAARTQTIARHVPRDPSDPGAGAVVGTQLWKIGEHAEEGLLGEVGRVARRAVGEDDRVDHRRIADVEGVEGVAISRAGARDQHALGGRLIAIGCRVHPGASAIVELEGAGIHGNVGGGRRHGHGLLRAIHGDEWGGLAEGDHPLVFLGVGASFAPPRSSAIFSFPKKRSPYARTFLRRSEPSGAPASASV